MGEKMIDGAPMYRVAQLKPIDETLAEMDQYRKSAYRHFQIKVGGDACADIERIRAAMSILKTSEKAFADANQGWTEKEAVKVVSAIRDLDVIIEQPCPTYEECAHIRAHTDLQMKLDECVTDLKI